MIYLITALALGSTFVPTSSVGGQTWTEAGSPYRVAGDITVPAGTTLAIEPGTVVEFINTSTQLDVRGTLQAVGSTSNPIVFEMEGNNGAWSGIDIRDGAGSILRHVDIQGGHLFISASQPVLADTVTVRACDPDSTRENELTSVRVTGPHVFRRLRVNSCDLDGPNEQQGKAEFTGPAQVTDTIIEGELVGDDSRGDRPTFDHCTVTEYIGGTATVMNSIAKRYYASPVAEYSVFELSSNGRYTEPNTNLISDPLLTDDYHPTHRSPALAISNDGRPAGALDYDGDLTVGLRGVTLEGEVWSSQSSPIVLDGEITVPTGRTLTIEPGVEVVAGEDEVVYVSGKLDAQGTWGQPIVFNAEDPLLTTPWLGVHLVSEAGDSVLKNVVINDARIGMLVGGNPIAPHSLSGIQIRNFSRCGLSLYSTQEVTIEQLWMQGARSSARYGICRRQTEDEIQLLHPVLMDLRYLVQVHDGYTFYRGRVEYGTLRNVFRAPTFILRSGTISENVSPLYGFSYTDVDADGFSHPSSPRPVATADFVDDASLTDPPLYDFDGRLRLVDSNGDGTPAASRGAFEPEPSSVFRFEPSYLSVAEGETASVELVLLHEPDSEVTVHFRPELLERFNVQPSILTISPEQWQDTHTIELTGVSDNVQVDEYIHLIPPRYTSIVADASLSADPVYASAGRRSTLVELTNTDEVAVVVDAPQGLTVVENGDPTTFRVRLGTRPTNTVRVDLYTSPAEQAFMTPAVLAFDRRNWDEWQDVTVVAENDDEEEESEVATLFLDPSLSLSPEYANASVYTLDSIIEDDDGYTPGVLDLGDFESSSLMMNEGESVEIPFTVWPAPRSRLVLPIQTTGPIAAPSQVIVEVGEFGGMLTVTADASGTVNNNEEFSVVFDTPTESDTNWEGVAPVVLTGVALNTDLPQLTLTTPVMEEGGAPGNLQVRLVTPATEDTLVSVQLPADVFGVDTVDVVIPAGSSSMHTASVNVVDNNRLDGPREVPITASASSPLPAFDSFTPVSSTISVSDDDSPQVHLSPASVDLVEGASTTLVVQLLRQPLQAVELSVRVDNESIATVDGNGTLEWSPLDWDQPLSVQVIATENDLVNGAQNTTLRVVGSTGAYATLEPQNVPIFVTDNDRDPAGIALTLVGDDFTSEAGVSTQLEAVLTGAPTHDVELTVAASLDTEASLSPQTVLFSALNWNVPQEIVVTGRDDDRIDGAIAYQAYLSAVETLDPEYASIDISTIPAIELENRDDDSAGITLTPQTLMTGENGIDDVLALALTSEPSAEVVLTLQSDRPSEAQPNPDTVSIGPDTWMNGVSVDILGLDDDVQDGDQPYTILVASIETDDADYSLLMPAELPMADGSNADDDVANVIVSPRILTLDESGSFTVVTVGITAAPTQDIRIGFVVDDPTEATVSTSQLTFLAGQADVQQEVVVSGVDDDMVDGDQPFRVYVGPIISADPVYGLWEIDDITGITADDDEPDVDTEPDSDTDPDVDTEPEDDTDPDADTEPEGDTDPDDDRGCSTAPTGALPSLWLLSSLLLAVRRRSTENASTDATFPSRPSADARGAQHGRDVG